MDSETAWASGLFEGEGSFTLRLGLYTRAQLVMADEDTVRRFHRAVGVGRVYGPYAPRETQTKEVWAWNANTFEEVQSVIAKLWFGLGTRRRLAAKRILAEARVPLPQTRGANGQFIRTY